MSKNHPSLPAKRAFVLQIHTDAHVERGQWKGRVEHLVSGEAEHSESLEELTMFLIGILIQ